MPEDPQLSPSEAAVLDKLNNATTEFFADIEFPSDALSVKRLRRVFPDQFDKGYLNDGFTSFFDPESGRFAMRHSSRDVPYLDKLNRMLDAERIVLVYSLYEAFGYLPPESRPTTPDARGWEAESHENYDKAKQTLEEGYQLFKLADSPATARLLIQNVENAGRQLAEQARVRHR